MSKVNVKDAKYDVIVVGGGLAGLSCAFYACKKGKKVLLLEKRKYLGGRTSSYIDMGMEIDSGLHRYIGYYKHLPKLLKQCGIRIKDIITWEEELDICVDVNRMTLGIAPFWAPIKTIRGVVGNKAYLSREDKLSLVRFFIYGIKDYFLNKRFDEFSVAEYARHRNVTKNAQNLILEPFSSGLFFLPIEEYSIYAFFKMFIPAIPKFYKMRVGAFEGGMTEVMCNPIGDAIKAMGGVIELNEDVESLIINDNSVIGVQTRSKHAYYGNNIVVATPINSAKELLTSLKSTVELEKLFKLPTMGVCTVQIDLSKPSMEKDITTFGPGTDLVSFTEQSRSTFRNKKGRLSVIVGKNQELCELSADVLLKIVITQLKSLGIDITNTVVSVRKTSEKDKFYSVSRGSQKLRPKQKTGIKGLILAGDYTLTSSICTMESAVISGKKAAKLCEKNNF